MRSRFAAYRLGLGAYIIATTDPQGPQWNADRPAWLASIHAFGTHSRFQGLRILAAQDDQVHFHAQIEQQGRDCSFSENSRFVLRDGAWLYHGAISLDRS